MPRQVELLNHISQRKETYIETTDAVPANQAAPRTLQSAAVTNGKTGILTSVFVAARVGMTVEIKKTVGTPTTLMKTYIPFDGGQVEIPFENVDKNQMDGNGTTSKFEAVFLNDDLTDASKASALFQWIEVG